MPPEVARRNRPIRDLPPSLLTIVDDDPTEADPGAVILTCANCGAAMDERKCRLVCGCGYFLGCSDYY